MIGRPVHALFLPCDGLADETRRDTLSVMIFLLSDVLYRAGGIETYLHALATHLHAGGRVPFRVVVAELESCPLVDELAARGVEVYRQRRLPGDRWLVRQWTMLVWLFFQLKPGDWVFCVRQPMPQLYLTLARLVHGRGARLAASWMLAPEFIPPPGPDFSRAVAADRRGDLRLRLHRRAVPDRLRLRRTRARGALP